MLLRAPFDLAALVGEFCSRLLGTGPEQSPFSVPVLCLLESAIASSVDAMNVIVMSVGRNSGTMG